jgi:hypothetical protein
LLLPHSGPNFVLLFEVLATTTRGWDGDVDMVLLCIGEEEGG